MHNDLLATHPPRSTALIEADRSISYGELAELVAQTAGALRAAGVDRGDRVVVLGPNDVAFVTGFLATQLIGAVVCPLDSRNPSLVIAERVQALSPESLLASPVAAEAAVAVAEDGLVESSRIGTAAGSPTPDLPSLAAGEPASAVEVDGASAGAILHTSGIVGPPRAAVLSHDNLLSAQQRIIGAGPGLTEADVGFAVLPFAHVLGLNMCLLPSLRVGAAVVLQSAWDAGEALELIARHSVTHLIGVPPMWVALTTAVGDDAGNRDALRSVTFARTGASTLHQSVAEAVHDTLGLELAQGYGLTETAGTVTFELAARRHPGSVGRPLPDVELKLVEDGNVVEQGDRGEIWIRTGSVFQGYLGDAAATAEVLISDGWCRTGDVGIQDDDGTLYLVGRSKDLINVSGFNVFPGEVEAVLETHPAVRDAVVVGEPHEVTGERVVAYVTATEGGAIDGDAVLDHCRDRLSRYKVPAGLHVVDRLPLTATGKRVRSELR